VRAAALSGSPLAIVSFVALCSVAGAPGPKRAAAED